MTKTSVRAITLPVALTVALIISGCGNGLPHSSQVAATITPTHATVKAGGTGQLAGNGSGFTQTPIAGWIQEAKNTGGDDCGLLQLPPDSPCQFGYVIFGSVGVFPSSATYYAPQTPGTYHITFEATQVSTFEHVSGTASATITVTP